MKIVNFISLCLVMAIVTAVLTTLAVDAYFLEMDGHCFESVLIHHIKDCK